jgi:hypothetical protein
VRPGQKFELTRDMVVANIKAVAARLGVDRLSYWTYEDHGSFAARAITRKWKWSELCTEAGIGGGVNGRPTSVRKTCFECETRTAMGKSRYCRTCTDRMKRNSGGFA